MQTATRTTTLTTGRALELWLGLNALLAQRLGAVVRYRLGRTRDELRPVLDAYEPARQALVAEHVLHVDGEPQYDAGRQRWRFATPEADAAFYAEHDALLAQVAEVRLWPVAPADLGRVETGPECDALFGVVIVDPADAAAEPSGDGQPADGVAVPTLTPNGDA